jgi:hypothetical protein
MRRHARTSAIVTLAALLTLLTVLATGRASIAADRADYVVIVNAASSTTELDRSFVRDVYLRKATEWKGGATIRPVDLPAGSRERQQFVRDVIGKSPAQLRSYWNQRIFAGKGVPPPVAESAAAVVAYVVANPGAIGYIPAHVDAGGARVVRLR